MSVVRNWRHARAAGRPQEIEDADVADLNDVFSEAFTDRYRRDGMAGVRVPHLNPAVWRFAIADAGAGAMLWRDDRGRIIAFNVAHQSGTEAWMGPLAVHPDRQAQGLGKEVVGAGIELLRQRGATVIGLETMPRTMDNIGFYSSIGLIPGCLTLTVTIDAVLAQSPGGHLRIVRLGSLVGEDFEDALRITHELSDSMLAGYDFTRELRLTEELALGDTIMLFDRDRILAFAVCHSVPLVEGRSREELRVLKLVARTDVDFDRLVTALADHARRSGTRRVALRMQGRYERAYRRLVERGGRVRWSDLRMTLDGFPEMMPAQGIVLSNWEI